VVTFFQHQLTVTTDHALRGSMIVYDDSHLAWWGRSKRAVVENQTYDKRAEAPPHRAL
jgi:membrane-bound inhibitor of C-type lysozyme